MLVHRFAEQKITNPKFYYPPCQRYSNDGVIYSELNIPAGIQFF